MGSRLGILTAIIALVLVAGEVSGGWRDWLGVPGGASKGKSTQSAGLTSQQVTEGLKEALSQGIDAAIGKLGTLNGFFANELVKISLPPSLASLESPLRRLGQGKVVDEFVLTLNRAAEQAVPETAAVFSQTLKAMTLEDAMGILQGPDDAATEYFRSHGGEALKARILPIVEQATAAAGVTSAYKQLMSYAGPIKGLVDSQSLDLDGYVTDKALDGLFLVIAQEEKRIREDPAARTTELLKQVFGQLAP